MPLTGMPLRGPRRCGAIKASAQFSETNFRVTFLAEHELPKSILVSSVCCCVHNIQEQCILEVVESENSRVWQEIITQLRCL